MAREFLEQAEQEQGACGVQEEVGQVMAAGAAELAGQHAEELAVGHVGNPGERVPVGGVAEIEGPFETFPREAGADVGVEGDVVGIIDVEQREMGGLPIDGEGGGDQRGGEGVERPRETDSWNWAGSGRRGAAVPTNARLFADDFEAFAHSIDFSGKKGEKTTANWC